jgi:hypothetical protein
MAARAKELGIDLLGLSDHNTALNCPALESACREAGIRFLPGIEVTAMEECHVLCFFGQTEVALDFGREIARKQPRIAFDPVKLGDQVYVDVEGNILGEVEGYLGVALELSLDDIAKLAISAGGIVIPAHIDRAMFSVKSQLGFMPEGPWTAVESVNIPPAGIDPGDYPIIVDSDAHHLDCMGRRSTSLDVAESWSDAGASERFSLLRERLERGNFEYRLGPSLTARIKGLSEGKSVS